MRSVCAGLARDYKQLVIMFTSAESISDIGVPTGF